MLTRNGLPTAGFIRQQMLLAPDGPLPIAASTLWQWVKNGEFPAPVKLGPKVTAFRAVEVQAFLADPEGWRAAHLASKGGAN